MKITCSGCQAVLKVDDSLAGRRGKCPKCGVIFDIPKAGAITKPVDPPATDRQKNYAASLGIDFPPEITREEMCKLLDRLVRQNQNGEPRQERPVAVAEKPAGIMDAPAAPTTMPAETADAPSAPAPSFDLEGEDEDDLQLPAELPPLPPEPPLPVEPEPSMDSAAQPSSSETAVQASLPASRPSIAAPTQMLSQMAQRGLGAILITFPMEGDLEKFEGINFSVSFSQNLSEPQVRQALVSMAGLLSGPSA